MSEKQAFSAVMPVQALPAPSFSSERTVPLCLVLALGTFITDLSAVRINMAIVYSLPLVLLARSSKRRLVLHWAVAMVILTYGGYLLKTHLRQEEVLSYRLFNRTLVAASLLLIAALLSFWHGLEQNLRARRRFRTEGLESEDGALYSRIANSLERLMAVIISAILIICVAVMDAVTPAEFNLPILYAVPLVICALTRNRSLLWGILPVLLLFTAAGYFVGPPPTVGEQWTYTLQFNRILAGIGIVGLTTILHFWMRPPQSSPPLMP